MNIITILLLLLIIPLVVVFVFGAVMASRTGSDKYRRSRAVMTLSQMSAEQIQVLKGLYMAYVAEDVEQANKLCAEASPATVNSLVDSFSYDNRPAEYSAGPLGRLNITKFENRLKEIGYSESACRILPLVVIDNYCDVLEEMTRK